MIIFRSVDDGREVLLNLQGQKFSSFEELESNIKIYFDDNVEKFPQLYRYQDFVAWSFLNGWITSEGGIYTVRVR